MAEELLQCGHGEEAVEDGAASRRSTSRSTCFNAVTATMPWKTTIVRAIRDAKYLLQCGHGEEAVEDSLAVGFVFLWIFELQCGHGDEAVEDEALGAVVDVAIVAS